MYSLFQKISNLPIIFLLLTVLGTQFSIATEWKYVGFSSQDNENIFYVFIDKEYNKKQKEKILKQKHLFIKPQKSKENKYYLTIEFERLVNCENKTISLLKALFKNTDGEIVHAYKSNDETLIPVDVERNSINSSLLKEICDIS